MKLTKERLINLIIEAMDDDDYEEPYDSFDYEGATPSSRKTEEEYIGEHEGYKFEPNPKRFRGGDEDYDHALDGAINSYTSMKYKGISKMIDPVIKTVKRVDADPVKLENMKQGIMKEYGLDEKKFFELEKEQLIAFARSGKL